MRPNPFATQLRRWRLVRHLSQLELAVAAGTTPRHLSFLETGRSRPSEQMVGRLASALTLPLREHNQFLEAAGHPPAYPEAPLGAPDMAPFRRAIDRLLAQHAPFPAYVLDRHWNIVETNEAAVGLLAGSGERNAVRLMYGAQWRVLVANWDEIAWAGVARLQDDAARRPADPVIAELLELATEAAGTVAPPPAYGGERVLCPHFRIGGTVVRTLSVVAQFGSPQDVTLDELRVDLVYPADDAAEAFFRRR